MKIAATALAALVLGGCLLTPPAPIDTVERVDLPRFMGDWYVIAHIPTFPERKAYNAVESYELADEAEVATTFTFNHDGFDGPHRTMKPTGFVEPGTGNAVWAMQFVWPFKAEYRVVYLDEDYDFTIIGRSRRDYAWIMARSPEVDEAVYEALVARLAALGYDVSEVRRVPHGGGDPSGQ